jgi:hypothetical protein
LTEAPGQKVSNGAAAEAEDQRALRPDVGKHEGPVARAEGSVIDEDGLNHAADEKRSLPFVLANPHTGFARHHGIKPGADSIQRIARHEHLPIAPPVFLEHLPVLVAPHLLAALLDKRSHETPSFPNRIPRSVLARPG